MFTTPFETKITSSRRVLIVGCGGGYDVFAGLPLYHELNKSKTVFLANLSFTDNLFKRQGRRFTEFCVEILPEHKFESSLNNSGNSTEQDPQDYFPELLLAKAINLPVYAFRLMGVQTLRDAYKELVLELDVDTIVLIDGGHDALCFGDEEELGTPEEDMINIMAVNGISSVPNKFLVCIGLGIETEVSEYQFLENVADIKKAGGFLGCSHLTEEMESVQFYKNIFMNCRPSDSCINSSIVMSLDGKYGNVRPEWIKRRLEESDSYLFAQPLAQMYWFFSLDKVAERNIFVTCENLEKSGDFSEACRAIKEHPETSKLVRYDFDIGKWEYTGTRLSKLMFE